MKKTNTSLERPRLANEANRESMLAIGICPLRPWKKNRKDFLYVFLNMQMPLMMEVLAL